MLRREIAGRQRALAGIRGELRKNISRFLREHRAEVFTVSEILDLLGLGPKVFRDSSPCFSPQIYCADYGDICYCAEQAVSEMERDKQAEMFEIAGSLYYGDK